VKRFEILGNAKTSSTLCYYLTERMTYGAAKKAADLAMWQDGGEKFSSVDVDDGRGTVLYRATPEGVQESASRSLSLR
jgi:hypothetical protein